MDSTISFADEVEGATRSGNSRGRDDEDDHRAEPGVRRLLPVPSSGRFFLLALFFFQTFLSSALFLFGDAKKKKRGIFYFIAGKSSSASESVAWAIALLAAMT